MTNEDKSYFVSWEWIDKHGIAKAVGDAIIDTAGTLTSDKRDGLVREITAAGKIDGCTLQIKTINLL
ncbi:hypothetical protein [Proteus phage vB_PmiP_RS51pmB]|nr:hypothetical protein [Proteus phage vB_PmiP_RS51pmB]